jgi:UDP-GlcNAc3NAcA epimerase
VETVEAGWNRLAGAQTDAILAAVERMDRSSERPPFYGDGHAAEAIVGVLERVIGMPSTG